MTDTLNLVQKISCLAKLNVPKTDEENMEKSLKNIIQILDKMTDIDTSGVDPLAHPLDIKPKPRQDQVSERNQRSFIQNGCTNIDDHCYTVPPVINQNQEDTPS